MSAFCQHTILFGHIYVYESRSVECNLIQGVSVSLKFATVVHLTMATKTKLREEITGAMHICKQEIYITNNDHLRINCVN